jgi:hypothetical protein
MALDITITPSRTADLGNSEQLRRTLSAAFPGIEFGREPSGLEKIEKARKAGIDFGEIAEQFLRDVPEKQAASFQNGRFTIDLFWEDAPSIPSLDATVTFSGLHEAELCEHLARLPGCDSKLHDNGRIIRGR